ncbi:hypothetical protein HXX76_004235 [Chlamydomonas incerta]|uniref:Replication termination factor 2 n=1 Tax=Chlamydomonas incerta TaxID=51695 RepID=A0A835TKC1_CHLIN|nr:hypothetical protein HXX76_004235 [Chlamydomonas incerta]|eukprot:KAG2440121.1 hypothetical protein HXX76_004235 [Chlamydomonas incerta]
MRLQYGAASLPDDRMLGDFCSPSATLQLSYRLRGGGGDGGSTGAESRSCYMEMYANKKVEKVNPEEARLAAWTRCHLSGELLAAPCVADELGNLYNKDALIVHLLDKTLPPTLSHITGLRSVIELKLTPAAGTSGANGAGAAKAPKAASQVSFQPSNESQFTCPVSGTPFNGRYKFVILRPSGLVVSERAIKEVPAAVEELAGAGGKKLAELESIPVNPTGEQLEQLRAKLAARAAEKAGKAASKKDKKRSAAAAAADGEAAATGAAGAAAPAGRGASPPLEDGPGGAAAAAAAAAKRLKIPQGASKDVYSSIFSTNKGGQPEKETFCCRALSARGMNLT